MAVSVKLGQWTCHWFIREVRPEEKEQRKHGGKREECGKQGNTRTISTEDVTTSDKPSEGVASPVLRLGKKRHTIKMITMVIFAFLLHFSSLPHWVVGVALYLMPHSRLPDEISRQILRLHCRMVKRSETLPVGLICISVPSSVNYDLWLHVSYVAL